MRRGKFYWLGVFSLILIAGLVGASTLRPYFGYKLFVVQSGSMEPAIRAKSLVLVKKFDNYKIGDVITYKDGGERGETITHRIVKIKNRGFVTKGDANNVSDERLVSPDRIVGKVVLAIPFLGYPVAFAKTQWGLIILIIIPGTIIVYSELLNIKEEVVTFWKKKRMNV